VGGISHTIVEPARQLPMTPGSISAFGAARDEEYRLGAARIVDGLVCGIGSARKPMT
jgi:hypothetical protein